MDAQIKVDCPQEILLGLHLDSSQFANVIKLHAAISLFREGKLSSGMAANWLGIPRIHFLMKAMSEGGAVLLTNSDEDFKRETSLLCKNLKD